MNPNKRRALRASLLAGALLSVAACAPAVRPPTFTPREEIPLAGIPTGMAGWPDPSWWKRYHDEQLDRIIDMAMRGSPDMEVAEARYRAALRSVDTQKADLMPQVRGLLSGSHGASDVSVKGEAAGASGSAQGFELDPGKSYSNTGIAGALFTWDLDLWGKQKAAVAAAVGQSHAAEAEKATAANSLQYNLARTYFDWQAMQARLTVARDAARTGSDYRELVALRVHAGLDDPQMLDSADSQLAGLRRNIAMLDGASALDLAQLAALAGVSPAGLGTLKPTPLPVADTRLPGDARLGLIARRPDIVSARWQIQASLRAIDSARAAYYPDVSLMGLGAFLRTYPDLGSGTRTDLALGNIGPSIQLPIYSGGRLRAQVETSQAQLDTAVANYDRAVVQAAQDVAQQILTLQQLDAERVQQDRQLGASVSQSRRADDRRAKGIEDDRTYLNSRLQLLQQRDGQLQIDSQLLSTNLALIHALGGGYQATDMPALPTNAAKDETR